MTMSQITFPHTRPHVFPAAQTRTPMRPSPQHGHPDAPIPLQTRSPLRVCPPHTGNRLRLTSAKTSFFAQNPHTRTPVPPTQTKSLQSTTGVSQNRETHPLFLIPHSPPFPPPSAAPLHRIHSPRRTPLKPLNFNAHHSPVGAYLTFTCGHHGTRGGLAAQLGKPADQDLFIGYRDAAPPTPAPLRVLPFCNNAVKIDPQSAVLPQKENEDRQTFSPLVDLTREYGWSTDRWKTADNTLEFNIYSPFIDLPDPATAAAEEMRNALLPAITAELIIDNRAGTTPKTGFFAINFQDPGNRILQLSTKDLPLRTSTVALAHRQHYAFAADLFDMTAKGSPIPVPTTQESPGIRSLGNGGGAFPFLRWWPHEGLEDRSNPVHLLGTTPGIGFEVPPGKRYTLRFALACYLPGTVTTRLEGRYLYTRHYQSLEDVLTTALDRFCDLKQLAKSQDQQLANSGLSENQQFLIAHSTRSYYANTQLLEIDNQPYWIVNEGEYCMMNTLDLAVDHVFWELERNPWVVRNFLDNFLKHYSYVDQVKVPQSPGIAIPGLAPGGISFTHDQGTHNQFSPHGQSSYELKDLTGCFSYMTQEQLCNWILIAASYVAKSGDVQWVMEVKEAIIACSKSFLNRIRFDPINPMQVRFCDSDRCGTGREITTYDSLDSSLAQASGNLYMVVKYWSVAMGLEALLALAEEDDAAWEPVNVGEKLAAIVTSNSREGGELPTFIGHQNDESQARILPAIETILFVDFWAKAFNPHRENARTQAFVDWHIGKPFEPFINSLRRHTAALLSDDRHRNKFPDHGIKLSSTSNNSWLSKIAIIQHVARSLFNLDENGSPRATDHEPRATGWEHADAAHVKWLTTGPGAYWCACDQIVNGEAKGSKYYPRLITMALWLREVRKA